MGVMTTYHQLTHGLLLNPRFKWRYVINAKDQNGGQISRTGRCFPELTRDGLVLKSRFFANDAFEMQSLTAIIDLPTAAP